ncbi:MAG: GIY-YIG nuclease family protein [Patescibacteria group bacterium]
MYKVYILQSIKYKIYYIGHTKDINDRMSRHNSGGSSYSKKFMPWKLIYTEFYNTKSEAYKRELEIKSYKGGIKFKKLIGVWEK